MTLIRRVWFASLLGFIVGCGGVSTADPGPPPPHGGVPVHFADGTGLIEVVKKKGTAPITAEASFYFYHDAWTPYEPAPESAVLVLHDGSQVPLQREGAAFVTPTGPVLFANEEPISGVLSIVLEGETRQFPLGAR